MGRVPAIRFVSLLIGATLLGACISPRTAAPSLPSVQPERNHDDVRPELARPNPRVAESRALSLINAALASYPAVDPDPCAAVDDDPLNRVLEHGISDDGKSAWIIEVIDGVEVKRIVNPRECTQPAKCAGPWIDGWLSRATELPPPVPSPPRDGCSR